VAAIAERLTGAKSQGVIGREALSSPVTLKRRTGRKQASRSP
jgi:hypothetical protein